ncbi:MAG: hypothetical protein AMXMBFR47_14490 [Planctomycetota bacterium]
MPSRNAIEVRPVRRIDVGGPPPEFDPAGAGPGGNPSARLLSQLLEHKWLMIVTFVVLASLGATGVWFSVAPIYRATASIQVSPTRDSMRESEGERVSNYEPFRVSQVDHFTRPEVINRVLQDPDVQKTEFYKDTPATELDKLLHKFRLNTPIPVEERLAQAISATAPKGKEYVYVSIELPQEKEPKTILKVLMREYEGFTNEQEVKRKGKRKAGLITNIEKANNDIVAGLVNLKEIYGTIGTRQFDTVLLARRTQLDAWLNELKSIELDLASMEKQADDAESASQPASQAANGHDDPVTSIERDHGWQQLNDTLSKAQAAVAAATNLGDLHPDKIRLQTEVARVQQRIQELEETLKRRTGLGEGPGPESPIDRLKRRAEALDVLTEKEERQYRIEFDASERALIEEEKIARLRAELLVYERELKDLQDQEVLSGIVEVFDASESSIPVEDKRIKFGAAAVFGAAAAAVALAFLRVRMTTHVQDTEVELGFSAGRILGRLPLRRGELSRVVNEPEYAEPLRVVRTTLLHALQEEHGQVVQITSAEPNSGKTTVATQLARSTALVGKRVLLVDADLYRASLSKRSDAAARGGLMLALETGEWRPEVIHDPDIETLALLPVGRCTTDRQAELLANGRLRRLIDEWRKDFDFIVIDSPPLLGPADSLILSGAVDGTIMIVRERHCRLRAVRGAMSAIESAGGRLLGTVVIGNPKKSHPYYASYQYTYGYGGYYRRHSGSDDESPKDKN